MHNNEPARGKHEASMSFLFASAADSMHWNTTFAYDAVSAVRARTRIQASCVTLTQLGRPAWGRQRP